MKAGSGDQEITLHILRIEERTNLELPFLPTFLDLTKQTQYQNIYIYIYIKDYFGCEVERESSSSSSMWTINS